MAEEYIDEFFLRGRPPGSRELPGWHLVMAEVRDPLRRRALSSTEAIDEGQDLTTILETINVGHLAVIETLRDDLKKAIEEQQAIRDEAVRQIGEIWTAGEECANGLRMATDKIGELQTAGQALVDAANAEIERLQGILEAAARHELKLSQQLDEQAKELTDLRPRVVTAEAEVARLTKALATSDAAAARAAKALAEMSAAQAVQAEDVPAN